jgi:hypothetical protein
MLDKNKPFDVVYGDPSIRFEQDGKKFDHKGVEIVAKITSTLHLKKDKDGLATGRSAR